MKKALALILALTMVFALFAGCGDTKTEEKKEPTKTEEVKKEDPKTEDKTEAPAADPNWNGDVSGLNGKKSMITVGFASNVATLTPALKLNEYNVMVLSEIFEHLGQYDAMGSDKFVGVIMKSWKASDDGLKYDIEIYDNIYDSAGNHMTANDIKFCVEKAQDVGISAAKYAKGVTVTGDYTLSIEFNNAMVGVFEEFCQNLWMYTQAAFEASPDEMATTPVGTGRYALVEYVSGSHARIEKRDDYWQSEDLINDFSKANIDVIHYQFITENTQMAIAVETGTVQIGMWMPAAVAKDAKDLEGRVYEENPDITNRLSVFNCIDEGIFGGENGKLLRQAVLYALDKDMIVMNALDGIGQASATLGTPGTIGYNEAWEAQDNYKVNVEKAKELMAEAGYPDGFTFRLVSSDNGRDKTYTQVVQTLLAACDIKAELTWVPSSTLGKTQNDLGAWDMTVLSYAAGNQYQAGLYNFMANNTLRPHGKTLCGISDDELQEMVLKANSPDWTQADVDAIHDKIVEEAYGMRHYVSYYTSSRVPEMTSVYMNWRGAGQIGASTYSQDWEFFAD